MFSWKKLILFAAVFCAAFAVANLSLFALQNLGLEFHYIESWPKQLLWRVFGQTVLMQAAGSYLW